MSMSQEDPQATDEGILPRGSLPLPRKERFNLIHKLRSQSRLIPIYFLAMVSIICSSKLTGHYSGGGSAIKVRRGEQEVANSLRGLVLPPTADANANVEVEEGEDKDNDITDDPIPGSRRLVRNPTTSDASPMCTAEQRSKIARQLMLMEDKDIKNTASKKIKPPRLGGGWFKSREFKCPKTTWIDKFYMENNIGSSDFLGISVGCNKGHDAIRTARMGLSDATIDPIQWRDEFQSKKMSLCGQEKGAVFDVGSIPRRKGEMHCIEPLPATFAELQRVGDKLGLKSKGMVFSQAAIASTSGVINFPDVNNVGVENLGMGYCNGDVYDAKGFYDPKALALAFKFGANAEISCVEVPKLSLDDYVAKYVKGSGPINILQIDVEGYDFDVLFGASTVLDSTHYLEFEYHSKWQILHIQDAVRLLDGKGFTCYWAGEGRLWRISGCYFEHYNYFRGWSNVACVHRSQKTLYDRMEEVFADVLEEEW